MQLSDEQKLKIKTWVDEGCGLSEIQERLSSELDTPMTYMEVRFLVLELGLTVKDRETPSAPVDVAAAAPAGRGIPGAAGGVAADGDALGGGVSVDVDRIMKPGSVVSGTVVFSDGVSATWMLDQMGRLAVDAGQPGYQPSEQDLTDFQQELRQVLSKRGF